MRKKRLNRVGFMVFVNLDFIETVEIEEVRGILRSVERITLKCSVDIAHGAGPIPFDEFGICDVRWDFFDMAVSEEHLLLGAESLRRAAHIVISVTTLAEEV